MGADKATNRRLVLKTLLASLAATPVFVSAQDFPSRPIRIILPFPAGGTMDSMVRPLGQEMTKTLGQPFVVENNPGVGSVIAVAAAAKSAPDGYTLVGVANSFTINHALVPKLPYDTLKDLRPVGLMARTPNVLVGHLDVSAKDLAELVAYARANPGKLRYGSPGSGTVQHLAGESLKMMAGINLLHVPYKGVAPAMTDLLGGQINLMIGPLPEILSQIRAGKLKSFGVTTLQRAQMAPDLPTVAEQGYAGFDTSVWFGLVAPAGVSDQIVARLNSALVSALSSPEIRRALAAKGVELLPGTPEEFAAFIRSEIAKYARVIKEANVKLD